MTSQENLEYERSEFCKSSHMLTCMRISKQINGRWSEESC